jgi:4-hydroxymandelate oxidase
MNEVGDAGFSTLSDLEDAAPMRLQEHVWAYIQTGAGEERTLRANHGDFKRWALVPRTLTGTTTIDIAASLLGKPTSAPIFVSPTAYCGQVHPEGELAIARACANEDVVASYSTLSSFSIEEIGKASGQGIRWFQLYLQPDSKVGRDLVQRAESAGFSALLLTVDVPVLGVRDRQSTGGFAIDSSVPIGNGPDVVPPLRAPMLQGPSYRLRSESENSWAVLDELRSISSLPIVVKGVLTVEDARLAADHGARGILVSNHGGRQLDGCVTPLSVLPEIVEAVGSRIEVYLDGGVRRGSDVLIALALGARAVGVGRPVLWALAAGGQPGVARYFSLLKTEFATAMALAGRGSLHALDRTVVRPA